MTWLARFATGERFSCFHAEAGIAAEHCLPPAWLEQSYLWAAGHADLHRRDGDVAAAGRFRDHAITSAPTLAGKETRRRRLALDGPFTTASST